MHRVLQGEKSWGKTTLDIDIHIYSHKRINVNIKMYIGLHEVNTDINSHESTNTHANAHTRLNTNAHK